MAQKDFESGFILSVVIKNSIPALIAMVMVMVYNLADTFFIGLTHDDLQVTAVLFGTVFCLVISILCFVFAGPIVKIFLTADEAFNAGIHFTRILMCTTWLIGAFVICQNCLQDMGATGCRCSFAFCYFWNDYQ